jgi:hypothetical protein
MVALYVNSCIVCGLFCSWPCVPTLKICLDIWDCVESYMIHMFFACRLMITFTSNLKLIIFFLVLLIRVLSLFKLLSLVASTRHAALNLACLLEGGQQA